MPPSCAGPTESHLDTNDCGVAAANGQSQMYLVSWCAYQPTSVDILGHAMPPAMSGHGVGAKQTNSILV